LGISDQQISQELSSSGWPEAEIQNSLSIPNAKKLKGIKPWKINTLVVLGALLIAYFTPKGLISLIVLASAIWVYIDAKKLNIKQYKKTFVSPSTTPFGAMFIVAILWLITFPMYITFRYRIINGMIPLKEQK
jgi:hypothetical protein